MAPQHWTFVIVPPGNERARTMLVTQRMRRVLTVVTSAFGMLVIGALGILFTPYATPGGRVVAVENARLRARLAQMDTRLLALTDTLAAIGVRDQQLRVMAGMPTDSGLVDVVDLRSGAPGKDVFTLAGIVPERQLLRPFLGRLEFSGTPDIEGMIRRATELSASLRTVSDTLERHFERSANTPSIMPSSGWLSSHFSVSRFHPMLHEHRAHEGIDLAAPMGAPIVAPASGVVRSVGYEPGYGNTFEIDHGNGIVTKFAHCSRIMVRSGQSVARGRLIAAVGNSGLSTGPHLHYEVHVNGKPVDPLKFILPGKIAD
ncbi:MAG TPA: M23 family metallopeptidase [Gemmatimonadaceae bacterium]|nr:M23 family metallopeptidase [Gemmatimonadaceae bacterium]